MSYHHDIYSNFKYMVVCEVMIMRLDVVLLFSQSWHHLTLKYNNGSIVTNHRINTAWFFV